MKYILFIMTVALIILTISVMYVSAQSDGKLKKNKVLWVDIKGFISSATSENVADAMGQTTSENNQTEYSAIILGLDTPGGSLEATLNILEIMQKSPVPFITFVYPQGTSAWSAGTIILLAGDYAAMAPVTTIGSAQPVLGNMPINDTKTINALKEKIVSVAEVHDRNVTQAARFITHNDNLTPEKALDRNVIESIADDPQDLLIKADKQTVMTQKGMRILNVSNAEIVNHQPSLRVLLVDFLSNPLIATTFFTIGFFSLIYGLTSPGFGVEIVGGILIILGLVGQGFDINWAAFALMGTGVGLLVYELYSPGFGAFGIGGIAVLIIGSVLMITQPVRPLLIQEEHLGNLAMLSSLISLPFALLIGFVTYKVWRSKKKVGVDFMFQNKEATALDAISKKKSGFVFVNGEYWEAKSKSQIKKGEKVKILGKQGHLLIVEPLE